MSRRKAYSNVNKTNQIRAQHVKGMGDTVFKGFQCLNPECQNYIFVKNDDITEDFNIVCPTCNYLHSSDGETKFFDYSMDVKQDDGSINTVETGEFTIFHDEYLSEALEYKYCIVCNSMKPLSFFDHHTSRISGHQGECKLCKKSYNAIKNGTRLTDQHRESAQKRRLLIDIAGNPKINSSDIEKRFHYKCFNCGKDLHAITDSKEKPLDHTLPVYYLWPLTTSTATLLCRKCNGEKSGSWPSNFYKDEQLKKLSVVTGIDYALLSGPPTYNPDALLELQTPSKVNALLNKYSAYMTELCKLRNRIKSDTGLDFFGNSTTISSEWIKKANNIDKKK